MEGGGKEAGRRLKKDWQEVKRRLEGKIKKNKGLWGSGKTTRLWMRENIVIILQGQAGLQ